MFRRPLLSMLVVAAAAAAAGALSPRLSAQQPAPYAPKSVTAADYTRAERMQGNALTSLVLNASVRPTWLDGDRFWYRRTTPTGTTETVLVDPATATPRRPTT